MRCSTLYYIKEEDEDEDEESYGNESTSNWPPTDNDDYEPSEFDYDPYDSYDWEC